jgi:hypothetical protein
MVATRAGLVMDPGSKVTYNGVEIGRVSGISEINRDGKPAAQVVLDVTPVRQQTRRVELTEKRCTAIDYTVHNDRCEYSPEIFCTIRNFNDVAPKIHNALGDNGYALGAHSAGSIAGAAKSAHLPGEPAADQREGRTRRATGVLAVDHPRTLACSLSRHGHRREHGPIQPL